MSQRKHTKNRSLPEPGTFVALGQCKDRAAWIESIEVDAVDDRAWFDDHPDASERTRAMSPREQKSTGLPIGTRVLVVRQPDGSQVRMFLTPGQG